MVAHAVLAMGTKKKSYRVVTGSELDLAIHRVASTITSQYHQNSSIRRLLVETYTSCYYWLAVGSRLSWAFGSVAVAAARVKAHMTLKLKLSKLPQGQAEYNVCDVCTYVNGEN